jgi:hypothetical protein
MSSFTRRFAGAATGSVPLPPRSSAASAALGVNLPPADPIGDVDRCRWCGLPASDLDNKARAECDQCGVLRPTKGPDADLVVSCDRCGGTNASMESGLCPNCERGTP